MPTRKSIIAQVGRELGWRTGSISSGTATSAVLDGYTLGDDTALIGATLCMPDAATEADRERTISTWDDSARTANWVSARSDETYTSETFLVIPQGDLTRHDLNTALNDVLAELRQSVHIALPTVHEDPLYRLGRLSWVRYEDDVDGVFTRNSPNLLANSQFEAWGDGPALAPSMWTLVGSGATIARTTSEARGYYSVSVTRVGADATLEQSIGLLNGQLAGQTVTMAGYVKASAASRGRIGISDGLTTTYSSYHTGGGADELLTVSKTLSAAATDCKFVGSTDTGNTTVEFSNLVAVEGSSVPSMLTDTGDQAYRLVPVDYRPRQMGNQLTIDLSSARARGGQIVIVSGQPYPALSADSDSTDCPDSVLIHGVVDQAVSRMAKGQLRDRLEGLRARHHRQFQLLSNRRRERPALAQKPRMTVMGA